MDEKENANSGYPLLCEVFKISEGNMIKEIRRDD